MKQAGREGDWICDTIDYPVCGSERTIPEVRGIKIVGWERTGSRDWDMQWNCVSCLWEWKDNS